ncbi:hypothetical protein H257_08779 [Aphanomyces astaci]|uniref:Uncharacterized protein n=1 Tax=Aphanomyces astaci TaxID=112090 RepID=W4GED7_APHAT|nr:hypothetical protein H257_08779 [Aphanomyces astaci]ETV77333.1 hypothetical protein H257_08779 [Aphanomyces astaci]|eukprot:XP_009833120.1 hypothetical protein H257_08779 [Aphanomyces astaci]
MPAIFLLSTQVLVLEPLNFVYHCVSTTTVLNESVTDQFIRYAKKIFLAASEQYTTAYVFKCNLMVWGLSAILSFASPTNHTATFDRKCEFSHVDFQLVFSNGTSYSGHFHWVASCLLPLRAPLPSDAPSPHQNSLFLAGSATHVCYVDQASAAINGILSLRIKNTFYISDLKICMFVIEEPANRRDRLVRDSEYHLLKAIPLGD